MRLRILLPTLLLSLLWLAPPAAASGGLISYDARLGIGAGTWLGEEQAEVGLAMEFGGGLRIALGPRSRSHWTPTLVPEIAFTRLVLDGTSGAHADAFVPGLGFGYFLSGFLLALVPAYAYSRAAGAEAHGFRVMFTAEYLHWAGVQASYQLSPYPNNTVHEVKATVSLNFLGLAIWYLRGGR